MLILSWRCVKGGLTQLENFLPWLLARLKQWLHLRFSARAATRHPQNCSATKSTAVARVASYLRYQQPVSATCRQKFQFREYSARFHCLCNSVAEPAPSYMCTVLVSQSLQHRCVARSSKVSHVQPQLKDCEGWSHPGWEKGVRQRAVSALSELWLTVADCYCCCSFWPSSAWLPSRRHRESWWLFLSSIALICHKNSPKLFSV